MALLGHQGGEGGPPKLGWVGKQRIQIEGLGLFG